jgi:AbrB family looped-hinge helix DNA binding protein
MERIEVTRVSTKGQVVIPARIRRALQIQPGMEFTVITDGANILLCPIKPPAPAVLKTLLKASRRPPRWGIREMGKYGFA